MIFGDAARADIPIATIHQALAAESLPVGRAEVPIYRVAFFNLKRKSIASIVPAPSRSVGESDLRASVLSLPSALAVAAFSGSIDRATFERAYAPAMCVLHQSSSNRPASCP